MALAKSASGLAYVEFERLVNDEAKLENEKKKLEELATSLGITLWATGDEFYAFCQRLTDEDDWEFAGTSEEYNRLLAEIEATGAGRK